MAAWVFVGGCLGKEPAAGWAGEQWCTECVYDAVLNHIGNLQCRPVLQRSSSNVEPHAMVQHPMV